MTDRSHIGNEEISGYAWLSPRYHTCNEARDISPAGLAFLYALGDLGIDSVTKGMLCLKACMLRYFADEGFISLPFSEICDIAAAEVSGVERKNAEDILRCALDTVWRSFNYYRLNAVRPLDPKWDCKERPSDSGLIELFCILARRHYDALTDVYR